MRMQGRAFWFTIAIAIQIFLLFSWYGIHNHHKACLPELELRDISSNPVLARLSEDIKWSTVKQKPPVTELHDKWVVVTTINMPTDDVKMLASMHGWKVVVVGDTKTPLSWR